MLVHFDGTRTKLAAENMAPEEATNSVQQSIQPVNQQAVQSNPPKNTKPAAGAAQTSMGTPKIYNPTLQRMGIQMPEPRDPRQVSTKLSQLRGAISRSQSDASLERMLNSRHHESDILRDADLVQTLKPRDYYDSPYMDTRDTTRLALNAANATNKSRYNERVAGGAGALLGAAIPLAARGATPRSLLASAGLSALGYLSGSSLYNAARKKKLRDYRYYLEGNPRR